MRCCLWRKLGLGLWLSLWLGLWLSLAFRRHDIERIGWLFMARLPWLAAPARLAIAIAILVIAAALVTVSFAIAVAISIAAGIAVTIILITVILVTIILVAVLIAAGIIVGVALFDTIAEALVSVVCNIVVFGLDLVVRAGIAARLTGLDQTEIMFGVLVEVFRPHAIARQRRIARELDVFVKNLGSIATDFNFRTIALIAAIGRITRLPSTTALALIIARPCFPAIHI
tara:strand:- start:12508 stop:13194 length:687 start_codon:yes stop_codon:yes gene_type:complete